MLTRSLPESRDGSDAGDGAAWVERLRTESRLHAGTGNVVDNADDATSE